MESFNSLATSAAGDGLGLNVSTAGAPMGMDNFDTDMVFNDALLDNVHGLQGLGPFTPTYDFDGFSTTFDDPFAYSSRQNFGGPGALASAVTAVSAVAHGAHQQPLADTDAGFADQEESPQDEELDNKLLSFSPPVAKATLMDESGQYVEAGLTAQLYGMFFVAEDVFGGDGNQGSSRPLELTCYRRNLWQCSGHVVLPRHLSHVTTDQGLQGPVAELAASITAIESIEGKPAEIISIPWKSANTAASASGGSGAGAGGSGGGGGDDHHKTATAPPRIPLDLAAGSQELDSDGHVSLPVSWKRLQFKHATANNGRRKGLQQHYVVQISLLAKLRSASSPGGGGGAVADDFVKIAEIRSGPVIVRGRSPRNFDSRRDVPLSSSSTAAAVGDKKSDKRSASLSQHDPTAATTPIKTDSSTPSSKGDAPHQQNMQMWNSQHTGDWPSQHVNSGGLTAPIISPHKKLALSPTLSRPPVPAWSSSSSSAQQPQQSQTPTKAPTPLQRAASASSSAGSGGPSLQPTTLPINLSLSEDERSPPNRANSESLPSPQFGSTPSFGGASGSGGRSMSSSSAAGHNPLAGSPIENADMLYEYFPLTLDDWLSPVDAIYRPHVVHHTVVPPEVKAQQIRTRAKRYFAAD